MEGDIHNYKRRYECTLKRINSLEIIPENKKLILSFKDYLLSEGIGICKIERYLYDLIRYSQMLKKPFKKASEKDLRAVIGGIETKTEWAEQTKRTFKIMLRKFHTFIRGIKEKGVYADEVKWISLRISNNHRKLPEELLTENEIEEIIRNASNTRDKALLSCLAESGCRISEIGNLKIKHVSFEEYGTRLTVGGKTGMRKILVISSTPYIQQWLNNHPKNDNPESYIWIASNGEQLTYTRMTAILKTASKNAGIKKRVYPHLLRHTRATRYATEMPEASMKQYFGWTQSSNMPGVYIHLSGKDTDESILRINGIDVQKEKSKPRLEPKKCLKCNTINEATNICCKICGMPLSKEEAQRILKADIERSQADEIMNKLVKDPEILELIKKKLS